MHNAFCLLSQGFIGLDLKVAGKLCDELPNGLRSLFKTCECGSVQGFDDGCFARHRLKREA